MITKHKDYLSNTRDIHQASQITSALRMWIYSPLTYKWQAADLVKSWAEFWNFEAHSEISLDVVFFLPPIFLIISHPKG